MPNKSIVAMAPVLSFFPFQIPYVSAREKRWEIPFKLGGEGIVVQGDIGKIRGLKFTVDTGATFSTRF